MGQFSRAGRHSGGQSAWEGLAQCCKLDSSTPSASKAAGSTKSRIANDQAERAAVEEGDVF